MSRVAPLAVLLVAFALAAGARADDPMPGGSPADEWTAPPYGAQDMRLSDAVLPEGWKIVEGGTSPAVKAVEDAAKAGAAGAGVPPERVTAHATALALPGGASATIVLIDVDADPKGLSTRMAATAEKEGWGFREMGSPARLLVVLAAEDLREKVKTVQSHAAARFLAVTSWSELEAHIEHRAEALARGALAIDDGCAPAHLTLAEVEARKAQGFRPPGPLDDAIREFRAAIDGKGSTPLDKSQVVVAKGDLAQCLLTKGGADAEAKDLLLAAVEGGDLVDRPRRMGNVYNLACAHARLKEKDKAFERLTAVLEENRKSKIEGIQHWATGDPDLDSLKDDPRWKALVDKYAATPTGE